MAITTDAVAPVTTSTRIEAFDGLRAIGFVLVFLFHAKVPGFFAGRFGVDVFFPLSGYLITDLLIREHHSRGAVAMGRFYARRAARLYPALLVTLGLTGALYAAVGFASVEAWATSALLAATYTTNIAIAWGGHVAADNPLSPTWSLALEEQFYLLWPWVLLVLVRMQRRRTAVAVVLAGAVAGWCVLATAPPKIGYFRPDARVSGLLLGCAMALWLAGRTPTAPTAAWCARAASGLALVAVAVGTTQAHEFLGDAIGVPAASAASTLAIPVLLRWPAGRWGRALSQPALGWIGRRSYALYLVHSPVLFLLWRSGLTHTSAAVVGAALSAALADAMFRYVEAPALAWRDRLSFRTR